MRLSMQQVVHRLYDDLVSLKTLGYGAVFICQVLREETGLSFRPHTLATYLSQERRKRRPRGKRRSHRPVSAQLRRQAEAGNCETESESPEPRMPPAEPNKLVNDVSLQPTTQQPKIPASTLQPASAVDATIESDPFLQELAKNTQRFHRPRNPNAPKPWA